MHTDLLNIPADIPFFSNLIYREIVYRLLQYSTRGSKQNSKFV